MPILSVEDLRKVYRTRRHGDVTAVDGVSFSVEPGEIVGLLGPNGAGKTSTIKCICTLVRPTSGRIEIDGVDATANPRRATGKLAAVLEGNRNVYWRLTPRENLEFFAGVQGIPLKRVRSMIDRLIDTLGLEVKKDAEARTLSRGQQQKLAVACAFVKGTPVLLLDEPTLGLDVETSIELRGMLRDMSAAGRTIVLSSHDMDVVQDVCQRVVIINHGRVVVSDDVRNLLELFRVRSYRFTIGRQTANGIRSDLLASFPEARLTGEGPFATVDVELADSARLYDLIDLLRKHGAMVESIERNDPGLEDVFLRIVRGEHP